MPMNLFKKQVSPRDAARSIKKETRRGIRSNQRDLDREVRELDREEQKIKTELKRRARTASSPNDPGLKALAKQLVQIRQNRDKLFATRSQVGAMGIHATTMGAQMSAASAMGTMTKTLQNANAQMDMKKTMQMLTMFQKENELINTKEELMDDMLADAFDTEEVEEEAQAVTNQVLAELGVELDSKMVGLDAPNANPATEGQSAALPDLQSRLNAL